MDKEKLNSLNALNSAIIRFRGLYSSWANGQGISYHELLVCYTIREYGFCTQKMICKSYLLPKQTINNVFIKLRKDGILISSEQMGKGREKAYVLSEKGEQLYQRIIENLDNAESAAFDMIGADKMRELKNLFAEYDRALGITLGE